MRLHRVEKNVVIQKVIINARYNLTQLMLIRLVELLLARD